MTRYLLELGVLGFIGMGFLYMVLDYLGQTSRSEVKRLKRALKSIANAPSSEGPGLALEALDEAN